MSEVINLSERREHVVIDSKDNHIHVLPMCLIDDLASGKTKIWDVDEWESVVKGIIISWSEYLKNDNSH